MKEDWFENRFSVWNLSKEERYMVHQKIAKIVREPNYQQTDSNLILVTAMSPTAAGEGKTTSTIGITDALNHIGKTAIATLRQPSLGPYFGKKGGATGGGEAQLIPEEKINLGLSGDFSSIESAHNLLAALIDNHNYYKKDPPIETHFPRCMDMNDRVLRKLQTNQGEKSFVITAASELMAIMSMAKNTQELRKRIGEMVVGLSPDGKRLTNEDFNFHHAAQMLLKEVLYPNLVRSKHRSPVLMHTGPFANIAQGTCSIRATALALELCDYTITEAGFAADLGAEKFFNIKCRELNHPVALSVIVVTQRAVLEHGMENVFQHIDNLKKFGPKVVVAINQFKEDQLADLKQLKKAIEDYQIPVAINSSFTDGPEGAAELAKLIVEHSCPTKVQHTYQLEDSIRKKIEKVAFDIYRANSVVFSKQAEESIRELQETKFSKLPICIAKTPYSFSDDPKNKELKGHTLNIREIRLQAGAGFIVAVSGKTMLMPGLPKEPRALVI